MTFVWFFYSLTNHIQIFPASTLQLSWLNQQIPFYAASVWIYFSYFAIFIFSLRLESDSEYLSRYFYGLITLNILSNLIFVLFPVEYVRDHATLVADEEMITRFFFELIFVLDPPRNCYPSLHVSMAFFTAFHWFARDRVRFLTFLLWAILISVSTLTTKQHYAVDVLSGLILAIGVYYLVFWRLSFRNE